MSKKLKARRGSSIAEMLVAVALLAILTAGGIAATAAVMASFNRAREASNADILASTVIEAISNEIRLGRGISIDAGDPNDQKLMLDSAFCGEGATLKFEAGRLVAVSGTGDTKQLLSADTYHDLTLKELKFEEKAGGADGKKTVYSIGFTVCNGSGSELWNGSASASPLQ